MRLAEVTGYPVERVVLSPTGIAPVVSPIFRRRASQVPVTHGLPSWCSTDACVSILADSLSRRNGEILEASATRCARDSGHHPVPHAAVTKGWWFPWRAAMHWSCLHSQEFMGSAVFQAWNRKRFFSDHGENASAVSRLGCDERDNYGEAEWCI